jgi:hypothetical protein
MVEGAFRSFVHDHFFLAEEGGTRMVDVLEFRSPYGLLGRLVDRCFLGGYLRRFLTARALALKRFHGDGPRGAAFYRVLTHLGWTFAWADIYRRVRNSHEMPPPAPVDASEDEGW